MSLFKILEKNSRLYPNKIALHFDSRAYTYLDLYGLTRLSIKNLYKKKLSNKNLLIIDDNSVQHICVIFASSFLNITVIPIGKYFSKKQIESINKIIKINGIILNEENFSEIKQINFKSFKKK